jgi:hypothetical protein
MTETMTPATAARDEAIREIAITREAWARFVPAVRADGGRALAASLEAMQQRFEQRRLAGLSEADARVVRAILAAHE